MATGGGGYEGVAGTVIAGVMLFGEKREVVRRGSIVRFGVVKWGDRSGAAASGGHAFFQTSHCLAEQ